MKLTSTLNRSSQASRKMPASNSAVSEASAACCRWSPPVNSTSDTPNSSEMAEVGPIATCRDEPRSA